MTTPVRQTNLRINTNIPERPEDRASQNSGSPARAQSRPDAGNPASADRPPKYRRRAVKALAIEVDATISAYKHQTNDELIFTQDHFKDKFKQHQTDLGKLQEGGLSSTAPASGAVRSLKSGAVIAAASTSRVGAVVAGAATGAIHATAATAYIAAHTALHVPCRAVKQGLKGAFHGGEVGAQAPMLLQPATVPVGAAVSAAVFGALGALQPVVNLPGRLMFATDEVTRRGSPARNVYAKVDRLSVALAHTKRKKQSTQQIAEATGETLAAAVAMVDAKDPFDRSFLTRAPQYEFGLVDGASPMSRYRAQEMAEDLSYA